MPSPPNLPPVLQVPSLVSARRPSNKDHLSPSNKDHLSVLFAELQNDLEGIIKKFSNLQSVIYDQHSSQNSASTTATWSNSPSADKIDFKAPGEGQSQSEEVDQTMDRTDSKTLIHAKHKLEDAVPAPMLSLLEACLDGEETDVQLLIQHGADPNTRFGAAVANGMKLTHSTPLAIAVLRDQVPLVKWLVANGADPDSTYGFKAGAAGMEWSGPCIHATVPRAKMQCMKALIAGGANIQRPASNGASLLWQAAYFNQVGIVELLLEHNAELERRAVSQDDPKQAYTSLHTAAKNGHSKVVEILLEAKADCDPRSGHGKGSSSGRSALQDAIQQGHVSCVKLLVARGPMSLCDREHHDCLDEAFHSGNTFLLEGIAHGLMESPVGLLDQLTRADLGGFLQSEGQTPSMILQAIFRPSEIRYWQDTDSGRRQRVQRHVAHIPTIDGMNVVLGPNPEIMHQRFKTKQPLDDSLLKFVNNIAPQERSVQKQSTLCPVKFLVCHVAGIHEHLDVLLALANSQCHGLFEEPPAQAIIDFAAGQVSHGLKLRAAIAVTEVINLAIITLFISRELTDNMETQAAKTFPLRCATLFGFVLVGIDVFIYCLEALGYKSQGLMNRFLDEWFHGVILCVTCILMVHTLQTGMDVRDSPIYCTALGTVIFIKWMELLFEFCQFNFVGMNILPIIATMGEVGPFFGVMLVCIIASANLYFALGRYDGFESFVLMYRLSVLGDFDLAQLETTEFEAAIDQEWFGKSSYYWVVRVMLLFVSFCINISLMNLYIGVLTVNYEANTKKALASFSRFKASSALEAQAVLGGWKIVRRFFCCCCGTKGLRRSGSKPALSPTHADDPRSSSIGSEISKSTDVMRSISIADMAEGCHDGFMWVCLRAEHP